MKLKESCDANMVDWKLENTTSRQLKEQETRQNGGEVVRRAGRVSESRKNVSWRITKVICGTVRPRGDEAGPEPERSQRDANPKRANEQSFISV